MFDLPWWLWLLIAIPVVVIALFWWAWKRYRREVRQEFIAYLKEQQSSLEVVTEHEGAVVVKLAEEGELTFYLAKIYGMIAALEKDTPEGRRDVYEHFYEMLQEHSKTAQSPLSLAEHGDRILPRLVTPGVLAGLQEVGPLPHTPVPELGLETVYVLDAPGSVMYLTDKQAPELGLDAAGLHQRSLTNLDRMWPSKVMRAALQHEPVVVIQGRDTYEASRLLLIPERLEPDEQLMVAIPDRDTIVIAAVLPEADLSNLRKLARMPSTPNVLLNRPVRVARSGFELV
jgi:hypothetical protein